MLSRHNRLLPCYFAVLAFGACTLDQRKLELARAGAPTAGSGSEGSTGGADSPLGGEAAEPNDGGAPSSGGSKAGGSSGMSGMSSPSLAPIIDGCADLDTDGVADCKVTLVANPSFKSDVSSWAAQTAASLTWDSNNALVDSPSGCALLAGLGPRATDSDGSELLEATQCVAVSGRQVVVAYANAFIEPDDAADMPAQAELEVSYFDGDDCSGERSGYFETPHSTKPGKWATIQAGGVSGAGTRSVSIGLVGIKPFRAEKLAVCFDNVMLKLTHLEP